MEEPVVPPSGKEPVTENEVSTLNEASFKVEKANSSSLDWEEASGYVMGGGCFGVILGAIAGMFVPFLYLKFTDAKALLNADWGMVYLKSLPVGAFLGAVLGGIGGYFSSKSKGR